MQTYYYDDDCLVQHWQKRMFDSDEQAVVWAQSKVERYKPTNAVVYTDGESENSAFRVIKEWRNGS